MSRCLVDRARGYLCYVEQLRWPVGDGPECVAEHGGAERAGGGDGIRSRGCKFFSACKVHTLTFLLAEKHLAAAGTAAEGTLAIAGSLQEFHGALKDVTRLIIHAAVASQIAGIVIDDFLAGGFFGHREAHAVAGEELRMVLDFDGLAGLAPIGTHGTDAVGADAEDLLYLRTGQGLQVFLGKRGEKKIVARRRAGSPLHFSFRSTPKVISR